jgi:hypothetical protein
MRIRQTPPRYEILNGESGTLIRYNDYGLPGITSNRHLKGKSCIKIAVCGSSFVMGQLPREEIASSVAQIRLDSLKTGLSLFNLGEGNHGPFMSYLRTRFYDKIFKFDYVIYINDGNWEDSASHWKDIRKFSVVSFKEIHTSKVGMAVQRLRSLSRLINIIAIAAHGKFGVGFTRDHNSVDRPKQELTGYRNAIYAFTEMWKCRFVVVNVSDMVNFNQSLSNLCNEFNIHYYYQDLMKSTYRINGSGHFNRIGNRKLGEMIVNVLLTENITG